MTERGAGSTPQMFRPKGPAGIIAQRLWAHAGTVGTYLRRRRDAGKLHWVFLATLPNAGSTALAEIASTSSRVRLIGQRGEGQWLLPELSVPGQRWHRELPVDYRRLRKVWTDDALRQGPGPAVVFEKSPPNIVRMRRIVEAFSDVAQVDVIGMTRDPVAICASWAHRYSPAVLVQNWTPGPSVSELEDERLYYRTLGRLCGERLEILAGLDDLVAVWIRYEDLADRNGKAISELLAAVPALDGIDLAACVNVKDYPPQPLRNMNCEQRARLSPTQLQSVVEGLAPYQATIERLGYRLPPVQAGEVRLPEQGGYHA